jgi:hypothetical protein
MNFSNKLLTDDMLTNLDETQGDVIEIFEKYQAEPDEQPESGLPLSARGTPACDDCCMCRLREWRIRTWSGLEFTNRAQCDSEAGDFMSC